MLHPNRFQDEHLTLTNFQQEVLVVCPTCSKKAIAKVDFDTKLARLICAACGCNKETSIAIRNGCFTMAANFYFQAELWLKMSFKNELFWAYNDKHLDYLKRYISATLREHKDRTGFTLLEKLPKFYHEAKNREGMLKIIEKLKNK